MLFFLKCSDNQNFYQKHFVACTDLGTVQSYESSHAFVSGRVDIARCGLLLMSYRVVIVLPNVERQTETKVLRKAPVFEICVGTRAAGSSWHGYGYVINTPFLS